MGYINFKEECFTANEQLKNRILNNENLFNKITSSKKLSKEFTPSNELSFKCFKERTFGNSYYKNEKDFITIENKNIICSKFYKCNFNNLKFKNCKFIGCIFEDCNFEKGGVIFEKCILIKEDSDEYPNLNRKDNWGCTFKNCKMYVKFISSNIGFAIFDNCFIYNSSFQISNMTSVVIINSELKNLNFEDISLFGAKIINTYIIDLEFTDKNQSKLDEQTFVDRIPLRYRNRNEYEGLYMVYETLANKFNNNSLKNNFGEYYFLCKNMQRKTLNFLPKTVSYLYLLSSGYGERPLYSILFSLFLILFFAILYLFLGLDVNDNLVQYTINSLMSTSFLDFINDFNEAFNLSVGMFAGIGLINCQPIPKAYFASNIEMLVGVVMVGIGTSTLIRKLIK
ncbi:pentapeptide repeat-containing protein [Clostridium tarantellae]|uniref:Pentapeptide repeat-containing protein n=1 Tax=Clostridium tarantellae TaxID=39493 RepID=A0A6I1MTB3_9CLOT|nr:pentapeptide repeat-containing protein [Clostridium tarantellae]MPQ43479.1 pentapeptide repeat-containing protein [Clostridium tarantellae]